MTNRNFIREERKDVLVMLGCRSKTASQCDYFIYAGENNHNSTVHYHRNPEKHKSFIEAKKDALIVVNPTPRIEYFHGIDKELWVLEEVYETKRSHMCDFCDEESFYDSKEQEFYCPTCNGVPWENHLLTNTDLNR